MNGVTMTWPFASLPVCRGQAELRDYATEPIRLARSEVTGLRWMRGPFGRGLKFRTVSGRLGKVTFCPLGKAGK